MASKDESKAQQAWAFFDEIVSRAAPAGVYTSPWEEGSYEHDRSVLRSLLSCALHVVPNPSDTKNRVAAKALDVWLAYELRRAGFHPDSVWPRATHPRVVSPDIRLLLDGVPQKQVRPDLEKRLYGPNSPSGVVSADANILGVNYTKQVDVVMSSWQTGPEILISTKRMDGSYAKNAANRIEEANGDSKNLRGRHPMAALGFMYGLRSEAFAKEPRIAGWLVDQLQKLNRDDDDAYMAVCLIVPEYENPDAAKVDAPISDDGYNDGDAVIEPGAADDLTSSIPKPVPDMDTVLTSPPTVTVREDLIPTDLHPDVFLAAIVNHVLDTTPVDMHTEARRRAGRPFIQPKGKKG